MRAVRLRPEHGALGIARSHRYGARSGSPSTLSTTLMTGALAWHA